MPKTGCYSEVACKKVPDRRQMVLPMSSLRKNLRFSRKNDIYTRKTFCRVESKTIHGTTATVKNCTYVIQYELAIEYDRDTLGILMGKCKITMVLLYDKALKLFKHPSQYRVMFYFI